MNIDKLAQIVEAEVKKALMEMKSDQKSEISSSQKKHILALFTGGYAKLDEAINQIEKLIKSSYTVDVVMSQSAVNVIGKDKIERISGIGELTCEPAELFSSLKAVQKCDFVIVPVLTRNSSAKIALGIADTLVTNIIMQAIISGKPVIAGRNSADPDLNECPCIATSNTPQPLILLAKNYLKTLESYGIRLVDVSEIADMIISGTNKDEILNQELITNETISKLPQGTNKINVARGTIITPMAKDLAKERGIEIVFVNHPL
ncbi:MAG: flavoprotein [Candidatus Poribacteria bacterium]